MATRMNGHDGNVGAGVIAGMIGGIAGTFAMNHVQALWSRAVENFESDSAAGRHDSRDWQERNEDANANEVAAQTIAKYTIERPLKRDELKVAATALHFAFGSVVGGLYGGLVETNPGSSALGGAAFGTAVWVGADEVAMPLLGLSRSDFEYPLETHVQAFVAHIVFGIATEVVRRGVRAVMRRA